MIFVKTREFFSKWYKGYWGMVAISAIGLTTLFFGGVVFTWQKSQSTKNSIATMRAEINSWEQWQPIYADWEKQKEALAQTQSSGIKKEQIKLDNWTALETLFSNLSEEHALDILRFEAELELSESNDRYVAVDLRLQGKMEDFRQFFLNLTWSAYAFNWQTLGIEGSSPQPQYQITLHFPIT